ncbi:MAG: ABC transporter permease [Acidobacteriota bacterium]|nr:ABC transporter permease [Acidobacteriota bacterium]
MSTLWQDIRHGLRRLRQSPGFVGVAVATLALGIGANTAIFSVVDGVLLRSLPYRDFSRLVAIWSRPVGLTSGYWDASLAEFLVIRNAKDVFSQVAFTDDRFQTLTGLSRPEVADVGYVPGSFFAAASVPPLLGRTFFAKEEPGRDHVTVLSYALWKRQFGGDRAILGRALQLDDSVYTIIGVMPPFFQLSGADLWVPLDPATARMANPEAHYVRIFAWLRPGVSLGQAQGTLDSIATRMAIAYPKTRRGWGLVAVPYLEMEVGDVRLGLLLLFGAVGLVLLIACANLGNLLLARGLGRGRELAIRSALGATRGRIARNLLTESMLVALAGGVAGLVLGWLGVGVLRAIAPPDTPRLDEVGLNAVVYLFTLGAAIFAGILSGLAPALRASRQDVTAGLKEGGAGGPGSPATGLRVRNLLVGVQVALCVVLLAGSLLALRSFERLLDVNLGFRADRVLSLGVSVPEFKYPKSGQQQMVDERILDNLRALPGVESASAMDDPILEDAGSSGKFSVESESGDSLAANARAQVRNITSDYFQTLGVPLLAGRQFTENEVHASTPVAVVSESFGRRYFLGRNPVGGHLIEENARGGRRTINIVGIVANVRDRNVGSSAEPTVYLPLFGTGRTLMTFFLVQAAVPPSALAKSVEEQIWRIDKDLPIRDVTTLNQAISKDIHEQRFETLLFSAFAVLGLTLALVGIYGVTAYSVGRRTQEIGVRVALGARPASVVRLVVLGAMPPVLIGIGVGVAGALALTRLMRSLLYEISPSDPATFARTVALMLLVALLACVLPARRATRVDPATALRHE